MRALRLPPHSETLFGFLIAVMPTLNNTSPGSKFANGKRQWKGKYYDRFKIQDNIHGISSELWRSHSEEDGGDKILEPICGLFGFGQASAHPQINQPLSVGEIEMLYQYAVSCKKNTLVQCKYTLRCVESPAANQGQPIVSPR